MTKKKVALLIETSNRYGRDLLYGIRDWIREHENWGIRLVSHDRGESIPGWLKNWHGDGVIARVDSLEISAQLKASGLPVVDVSDERKLSDFPSVGIDNRAVAELAFAHLTDKGFRSLAYCGDPRFLWSQERKEAFLHLAASKKVECQVFSELETGKIGSEEEIQKLARWLRELTKPVGVFACYDSRAQQVIEACLDANLQVPDEVSVLGVDNDEVLCELCTPPLSSIQLNARKAGFEAASLLSAVMEGRSPRSNRRLVVPVTVIERQSSDPIAVSDPQIAAALGFIRQHACEGINIKDVLRAVPMSRTLFAIRFKKLVGRTPHEHIIKVRLDASINLLLTTELSVEAIAEVSGFSRAAYFSTVFHREKGMTPSAFRRQHHSRGIAA